jgi:hypothetical protein
MEIQRDTQTDRKEERGGETRESIEREQREREKEKHRKRNFKKEKERKTRLMV